LISVVLNDPRWYTDSAAILDYSFARLAAAPQDEGAEVLSVARRGIAAWLMANATSTPPIPNPSTMAQGGGVPPAAGRSKPSGVGALVSPATGAGGPGSASLAGATQHAAGSSPAPPITLAWA